jgi:flagellar biosynthesis protein FlhB
MFDEMLLKYYEESTYSPGICRPIPDILDLQMFANPEDEGRTEDPTDYKKRKAREEGRVAKSQEFTSGLLIIITIVVFFLFGGYIQNSIKEVFHNSIGKVGDYTITVKSMPEVLSYVLSKILIILAPVLGAAVVMSLISNFAQVGFMFTTKPLQPKFNKIKPKFQRIFFSKTTAFNLLKSILKVALIAGTLYLLLSLFMQDLLMLGTKEINQSWDQAGFITLIVLGSISLLLFGLSIIDFFYQKWDFKQNLKMSRYELKEERKDTEGDPFVRQRLREKMREISNRRMMEEVPESDVVVTNPTHFAIAISYKEDVHQAPIVVAKGQDYVALRIKKIAKDNEVPVVENKPLARALFEQTEIGDEIPEEFYMAVAEILAYVYRLKHRIPGIKK